MNEPASAGAARAFAALADELAAAWASQKVGGFSASSQAEAKRGAAAAGSNKVEAVTEVGKEEQEGAGGASGSAVGARFASQDQRQRCEARRPSALSQAQTAALACSLPTGGPANRRRQATSRAATGVLGF
ncbi:unnamed protein product [Amoebophrya sp. A25]|nr:unnamed protein product [Amoebophrya sp. A25]|eukprot:GSA25T00000540001.1